MMVIGADRDCSKIVEEELFVRCRSWGRIGPLDRFGIWDEESCIGA